MYSHLGEFLLAFYLVEVNVSASNLASNLLYFDLNVNSDLAGKTCPYNKKSMKLFFLFLIWTFFTFSEHEVLANSRLVWVSQSTQSTQTVLDCVKFRQTDIKHISTTITMIDVFCKDNEDDGDHFFFSSISNYFRQKSGRGR